jgi:hypothetical protein
MSTEKQIAANRLNALKSTGPRTARGKSISSRNAVRHDLLDKRFILASECPDAFDAFAAAFYGEYRPATPTETALVDIMATARWRLIRMANFEAGLIDREYRLNPEPETAALPTPDRSTLAYLRAVSAGRTIETMNRAETRLQLQFNSALDRLDHLRDRRKRRVSRRP